jgi:methionine biosynthesis protein MetW
MHFKRHLKYDTFHFTSNMIFKLIGAGKKVLDVGCATGRLGEKLRSEKKCFVIGIDIDEPRAKLAQERLNKVIVANVEKMEKDPFPDGYFDIIIFADVLEHLKEPETVLRRFKKYLKKDGYALISIPNIANWKMRVYLLFGKWHYKDVGLLDKTHLRFFTLKTAKDMINRCGYEIMSINYEVGNDWIDRRMTSHNPANLWKGLLAFKFVFKAKIRRKKC